ncbi:MAG: uroporphyrinogen decarboxylase family protein [Methanobacteriota archaeon]
MEIMTASAGSYPRIGEITERQRHRRAYAQLERGEITGEEFERVQDEVTREVIEEQVGAGLDIVTDGQVRWYDPISHLAKSLDGCKIDGLLRFFDTNFYFRQPVIEGKLVKRAPILKQEFIFAKKLSKRPVKPILTGPYTLAKLSINRQGSSFQSLVKDLAEIIAQEVREIAGAGAEVIQIDEPAILKHAEDFDTFSGAIETISSEKGRAKIALYTYFGDAAPLYDKFLKLPVEVLGLDFTYSPKLLQTIERLGCGKDLGLGLIDGRSTKLEAHKDVLEKLERILPALGSERVYLNPSCGLGDYLPREIAFKKLQNMVMIAKKAKEMMGCKTS